MLSVIFGKPGSKYSRIIIQVLVWALVFLLPFIFASAAYDEPGKRQNGEGGFLYLDTLTRICWVLLFYCNTRLLIPQLVYKRKFVLFVLLQGVLFLAIMLVHGLLFRVLMAWHHFNFLRSSSHNSIAFLFTVLASMLYKIMTDKMRSDAKASIRQQENLKTELSFLRSQISPHFLFNVLNNMVALVRLNSDQLEPTIVKLSSLMQYMLYETDEEKVLLKTEIDYLQSYIDLQQQRMGDRLDLQLAFDVRENWHAIEPMLLIPFVENAFKHGTGMIQHPVIIIQLTASDNQLLFTVKNKFETADIVKDKTGGIGLANVKRRLALLYGSRQQLVINNSGGWFSVSLQLNFTT